MIRAKNEGRWIARTIASVRELCGENIFVMEDGSTDDTVEQALQAGARVLPSPFAGLGLNECRDKDWLLEQVKAACSPDWILMPDGDEELAAGSCPKILQVLSGNPPVDCFSLRFLYLWDSIDTVRLDGVYGSMGRQSLFRANSNLKFRSYYEGEGENHNHVGLHCSNAPGLGGMVVAPLNVFLLHYGYLHKADRIRKYEWILSIDPMNEQEDFYRHSVQGDIPEVPRDAKLKHGGPLLLQKLPGRLVPRFDVVPGPRVARVESFAAD
jgi:glycosyltransferase involved in cell wall biosynthesis